MVYGIFVLLNSIYVGFFVKRRLHLFIIMFFFVILIQPYFQKLTDPHLFGIHFHDINFERLKTNLIYVISFILMFLISKKSIKSKNENIFLLIFILFSFSMVNVFFAIDISRSLWMTIISILSPLLFYILLMTFENEHFLNEKKFYKTFLSIGSIFFILGFFYYFKVGLKEAEGLYARSGGGLYLSNYGAQISAFFFPIVIFSKFNIKFEKFIKVIFSIFFIAALFISLGRTAFVVYAFLTLVIIVKHQKKSRLKSILLILSIFSLFIFVMQSYLNIDLQALIEGRFFRQNDDMFVSLENDERFRLYSAAASTIFSNFFTGVGISNYVLVNEDGYSNIHNIFLNILIERGIFLLVIFITFLVYLLRGLRKCAKRKKHSQVYYLLGYGVVGFLLIGLTGNDIFVVSGYVNAWSMYFLILIFTIQQKCNYFYANGKES